MTRAQLDPSAHAPWASNTLTSFRAIQLLLRSWAEVITYQKTLDGLLLACITCQRQFDRLCDWNHSRGPIVQHRPPATFIADSLGLDFLNSISTPVDKPIDWLDGGDGLLKWLAQAKLVPAV